MPLFRKTRGPSEIVKSSKLAYLDKIGVGSFGKVFSVNIKRDKFKVKYALKELDSSKIINKSIMTQIRAEKDTMVKLRGHSSIVHLYSYWESLGIEKRVYFLMEYCDNGDMFDRVRTAKKLEQNTAAKFLLQIASALDFVHDRHIIYRDLKLENILLCKQDDRALLADFGLSKNLSDRDGRTSTICGTIQYMAPELLNDEPYGQAIDWWSLGVMAFVMLTGHYPHSRGVEKLKFDCSASDRVIMYKRIDQGLITYPEFLSEESITTLKLLLMKDEKLRATSTKTLKNTAWLSNVNSQPIARELFEPATPDRKKKSRMSRLMRSMKRPRQHSSRTPRRGSRRGSLVEDSGASPDRPFDSPKTPLSIATTRLKVASTSDDAPSQTPASMSPSPISVRSDTSATSPPMTPLTTAVEFEWTSQEKPVIAAGAPASASPTVHRQPPALLNADDLVTAAEEALADIAEGKGPLWSPSDTSLPPTPDVLSDEWASTQLKPLSFAQQSILSSDSLSLPPTPQMSKSSLANDTTYEDSTTSPNDSLPDIEPDEILPATSPGGSILPPTSPGTKATVSPSRLETPASRPIVSKSPIAARSPASRPVKSPYAFVAGSPTSPGSKVSHEYGNRGRQNVPKTIRQIVPADGGDEPPSTEHGSLEIVTTNLTVTRDLRESAV